jgi:hypothetical protein
MKRTILVVGILTGYSWATAGVAPFTAFSYCLVAFPCVAFVAAYTRMGGLSTDDVKVREYFQRRAGGATLSTVAPWMALLSAAAALEIVGLMLGGRSTSVPTLSTTVDHLLAERWERCLFCLAWLLAGAFPLHRLWQQFRTGES